MTLSPTVAPPPPTTAPRWRHFIRHAIEMIVAMTVGMVLLAPVWAAALTRIGLGGALTRIGLGGALIRPELVALIAATNMAVAMTVWMRYRGHGRARVVEMVAAMYVPYLLLIVPYWLGIFPGEHIVMGGHVLMLPAMAVAMLAHRAEYSRHHSGADGIHPLIGVLGRRWPTWLALAMSVDTWQDPTVPPPWLMLVLPAAYLFFGTIRGHLRDPRVLALQLAGLVLYLVLAGVAAYVEPRTAAWIVAAGWGLHALWDLAHHRADLVAPRWWSEWCGVVDAVIAVTIVLLWL